MSVFTKMMFQRWHEQYVDSLLIKQTLGLSQCLQHYFSCCRRLKDEDNRILLRRIFLNNIFASVSFFVLFFSIAVDIQSQGTSVNNTIMDIVQSSSELLITILHFFSLFLFVLHLICSVFYEGVQNRNQCNGFSAFPIYL